MRPILVHFGGSETAVDFFGYMEGAIESGYRCSDEILNRISAKENKSNL